MEQKNFANRDDKPSWSFITFCFAGLALIVAGAALFLYLVHPRLMSINPHLFVATATILVVFTGIVSEGFLLIALTAFTGKDLLLYSRGRSLAMKTLFPIALFLAKIFRYNKTRFLASFVRVNNALTIAQRARIGGDRILVLLPHCLQIDICKRKVTSDLSNCMRCGKCPVGDFILAGEKHNLKIEVVNGGTLARKRVAMWKPQGIVAVACERDLTFGIQDVQPIPVYGVINERPHGPCVNTCVDMNTVEKAILFFKQR